MILKQFYFKKEHLHMLPTLFTTNCIKKKNINIMK
jgi:hypothetical protein